MMFQLFRHSGMDRLNPDCRDAAPKPNVVDTAVIPAGIAGIQNTGR